MTIQQYARIPGNLQFATDQGEADYMKQVAQARARQKERFVIAPMCTVLARAGVLEEGAALRVEDLDDVADARGAIVLRADERLRRLVSEGVVLERDT